MKTKSKKVTLPPSPLELSAAETAVYRQIGKYLSEEGALKKIDSFLLSQLAKCWCRCQKFEQDVATYGAVDEYDKGGSNISGYYTALQRERAHFFQLCNVFGLHTLSREKILAFKADANESGGIMRKLHAIREKSRKVV